MCRLKDKKDLWFGLGSHTFTHTETKNLFRLL